MDPEQPEADVVEQQHLVDDGDPDDHDTAAADRFGDADAFPSEADPADVAEQRAIVPQDIDEP